MQANANKVTQGLALNATLVAKLKGSQLAECCGHRKMINIVLPAKRTSIYTQASY
jgi:hypothetical protein